MLFYSAAVIQKAIPAEPKWVMFELADNCDHDGNVELSAARITKIAERICVSPDKVWSILEEFLNIGAIVAPDDARNSRGLPSICRINEDWLAV